MNLDPAMALRLVVALTVAVALSGCPLFAKDDSNAGPPTTTGGGGTGPRPKVE